MECLCKTASKCQTSMVSDPNLSLWECVALCFNSITFHVHFPNLNRKHGITCENMREDIKKIALESRRYSKTLTCEQKGKKQTIFKYALIA